MDKKLHNLNDEGSLASAENLYTNQTYAFPEEFDTLSSFDECEEELTDLFNSKKMEEHLEAQGYQIPKLYIERQSSLQTPENEEFNLPLQSRDIYEETTYQEFQEILSRLQAHYDTPSDIIHFKINFEPIWKAIH